MASDTVQQIKDRLSIVDVVSQYVKLDRAGSTLRARCPFHAEKTPSFFVSAERGTFHCFGCGEGGDIFTFVEKIEGLDFKGALKVLADKAGVEIVYECGGKEKKDERERLFELMEVATIHHASKLSDDAKKYLRERGLKDATIKEFRLGLAGAGWTDACDFLRSKGFSDKEIIDAGVGKKGDRGILDKFRNRIMFPIADSAGRIIAFSGRIFGENASPEAPKYLNSPETPLFHKSRVLYGFDKAKLAMRKLSCAVLVEGQMDLLASHQAGWGNTVAVSGTAFTPEHAALIRRMTDNLVLALDADEAGIKAASRAARAALQGGLNVKVARLPAGSDPADLILAQGADAWKKAIRDSKDIITFLLDVLEEHAKSPDNFRRSVEAAVLPFLSDVRSPIAREQYVREIASRLSVSESAVSETLSKLPQMPQPERSQEEETKPVRPKADRARQAFALLLWQESLPKPILDIEAFSKELEEIIGKDSFEKLRTLPAEEQESLRFEAERDHGKSRSLESDARMHVRELLRTERLPEIHDAMLLAQEEGKEAEVKRLKTVYNLLKSRIAQLDGMA
ncbi:MAG TPA: DNA primase [Candidatus Paceibacterota bacterium]|nr:DNA primase [Candidatus Paceibacterota bacterium]